jgi:hypothetical protein
MPSEPRSITWRPDGSQLAVICAAGHIVALDQDVAAGRIIPDEPEEKVGRIILDEPRTNRPTETGNRLTADGSPYRLARSDDQVPRRQTLLQKQDVRWPAENPVNNGEIAYFNSGAALVAWGLQNQVHLFSRMDGAINRRTVQVGGTCADVSLSREGVLACVETGTRAREPQLHLLDFATGQAIVPPLQQPEWMVSPSIRRVACS